MLLPLSQYVNSLCRRVIDRVNRISPDLRHARSHLLTCCIVPSGLPATPPRAHQHLGRVPLVRRIGIWPASLPSVYISQHVKTRSKAPQEDIPAIRCPKASLANAQAIHPHSPCPRFASQPLKHTFSSRRVEDCRTSRRALDRYRVLCSGFSSGRHGISLGTSWVRSIWESEDVGVQQPLQEIC